MPKTTVLLGGGLILTVGVGIIAVPRGRSGDPDLTPEVGQSETRSPLVDRTESPPTVALALDHSEHLFGDVPIGGGILQTQFTANNTADESIRLTGVVTSCMCTTAVLEFADGQVQGPFGMPGHDLPTTLDRAVGPGEAFNLVISFDPAAHGPRAIGPVTRKVGLQMENGQTAIITLSANVTS